MNSGNLVDSRGLVGPLMELSLYHCVLCTMFKYELTRQEYIESTREKRPVDNFKAEIAHFDVEAPIKFRFTRHIF